MTPPCPDFEPLRMARLLGELDELGQARLSAHLAGCAPCAADVAGMDDVLSLSVLPPAPVTPPAQLQAFARETHSLHVAAVQRARKWRFGGGIAAAAAALLLAFQLPGHSPAHVAAHPALHAAPARTAPAPTPAPVETQATTRADIDMAALTLGALPDEFDDDMADLDSDFDLSL